MSDDYDGKVNGEVVLNLADWIDRRRDAVGPYADHIIHSVRAHETELSRLRAEVERLTAALSDERAHADALADTLAGMDGLQNIDCEMRDNALRAHRARRQG
ncbi:hypothetical protein LOS78_05555 [Paracoccus sp. MA]|uniref:hypothetical protein n=1 Tax=Paracoccus sp. MA TaxID=2895796 RepID=UPI001E361D82|nr:hypothetical protein [Paracoccus sp. MA]UFM63630.1 hypothetical protein LOS78_05555 [Paracoccus sp. MA]